MWAQILELFYYYAQERNTFNVVGILCCRPKLGGFLPWHYWNAIWRDTRLEYTMFLSETWSSALWLWSNIQLLSQQKLHIWHFSRQIPESLLHGRTHFSLIHSGKVVSSELMFSNKNIKTVPWGLRCLLQCSALWVQVVFNDKFSYRTHPKVK